MVYVVCKLALRVLTKSEIKFLQSTVLTRFKLIRPKSIVFIGMLMLSLCIGGIIQQETIYSIHGFF